MNVTIHIMNVKHIMNVTILNVCIFVVFLQIALQFELASN